MSSDTIGKVQDYKNALITKAEEHVRRGFPEKIVELNELLATPMFNERNFDEVHQEINIPFADAVAVNIHVTTEISTTGGDNQPEPDADAADAADDKHGNVSGTTVMTQTSDPVPCNMALCDMIKVVKPIIRNLVEDSNLLKMWISFMIPKIEDGNNFGVSIQEDTLGVIQGIESKAAASFKQISSYFLSRAKIVSKVAKYPQIDDYRRAVVELDEKEYLYLWLIVREIRNRYSYLHDIVIKNMEKLKKPRFSNAENLY